MSPTADGRHCGTCQTEVVDFTRLSDAEILDYLARHRGQHLCAKSSQAQLAPAAPSRWRRWLLAALALFGWHAPAQACAPVRPPVAADSDAAKPGGQVIVRGAVIDDASGQPVANARVLIKGTEYGTTTDATGRFELVMAANWQPLKSGKLALHIEANPFEYLTLDRVVPIATKKPAKPVVLTLRLPPNPERGTIMGRIAQPPTPVKPPQ